MIYLQPEGISQHRKLKALMSDRLNSTVAGHRVATVAIGGKADTPAGLL
jgi:hypothetical protein